MLQNPFTYGNPISDPARFYGRQHEVEQVYSRLRNPEFESSSLVGERRIGKTSMLKYLAHPIVREKYQMCQDKYTFIDVDLQIVQTDASPTQLWQRVILPRMAQLCRNPDIKQNIEEIQSQKGIDNYSLRDLFDRIDGKDQYIILLLDEFENVTKNANFGSDFFYGLRYLAIHHNLSLVTSSQRELIELCHSETIRSSPFFNIFANIKLGLYTEGEARQFITESLEGTGIEFREIEINSILQMAGFHPYFLQASCWFLFNAYQDFNKKKILPTERLDITKKNFCQEVTPHLRKYWNDTDDQEKIVLAILALSAKKSKTERNIHREEQLQEYYSHSSQTLTRLEKRGLIVLKELKEYALFNSIWNEWIVGEILNTENQQSYQKWLISNQTVMKQITSKAKEEIGKILPQISANYRDMFIKWLSDPNNLMTSAGILKSILGI